MKSEYKANLFAVLAFVLFGSTALFVKASHLNAIDLVFLRMCVCFLVTLPFVAFSADTKRLSKKVLGSSFATSAAIFLNMVCLFSAFKLAPISICVALFYSGPIFTILFRHSVNRTKFEFRDKAASILCSFSILLLVTSSGGEAGLTPWFGYALALLGGMLFGLIPIFEKGCAGLSPLLALTLQSGFAILCLAPFSLSALLTVEAGDAFPILSLGVLCTCVPFYFWWKATRLNPQVSPFLSYIDPLTASLIGTLILSEKLSAIQALATALLFSAAVLHVWLGRSVVRKITEPEKEGDYVFPRAN